MLKRLWLWLPPVFYMGVIFYLSAQSNPLPELTAHVWDKLLHSTEYAGLAFLLCRALLGEGAGWTTAILTALALASLYGGSDEIHQLFTPGRDSEVLDWVADTVGSSLGATAYAVLAVAWRGRGASGPPRIEPARTDAQ